MSTLTIEKIDEYTHTDSNDTYIYAGRAWKYKISRTDDYIDYKEDITISTAGSTVDVGSNVYVPEFVTIGIDEISIEFDIIVYWISDVYTKYLRIEPVSDLVYDETNLIENKVLSLIETPGYNPPYIYEPSDDRIYTLTCQLGDYPEPTVACNDIFFWKENNCHDFFMYTPMMYQDD